MSIQTTFQQKSKNQSLKQHSKDLNVLSLFSGCGGLDLGFEGDFDVIEEAVNPHILKDVIAKSDKKGWVRLKPTRFQTVFANDIRPSAKAVWEKNFFSKFNYSNNPYSLNSIIDLVKRHWDGEKGIFPNNVDVVTGGFPCQDFSLAGKRKGFQSNKNHFGEKKLNSEPSVESRGQLYMWMREVIDIVQPKVFIAENVKGMASLGNVLDIIRKDFETIGDNGYIVINPKILHAGQYGVPQSRERIFFIGFRKDSLTKEALKAFCNDIVPENFDPYPTPTHYLISESDLGYKLKYSTVRNALKGLREPEQSKDLSQKSFSQCKWYGKHCQGNTEVKMDYLGPTIRSEHHGNIEFRRLSIENGGRNKKEFSDGCKQRRLSVRECARIQTFPDDFNFVMNDENGNISTSEAYKLIGNAVPPLLGFHIAQRLQKLWPIIFKKK